MSTGLGKNRPMPRRTSRIDGLDFRMARASRLGLAGRRPRLGADMSAPADVPALLRKGEVETP